VPVLDIYIKIKIYKIIIMAIKCLYTIHMKNKRDRFLIIAENRTGNILKHLKLLGNCSNKSNYEYTENEVKLIFKAIDEQLKITKSKFMNKDSSFSLRKVK